MATDKSKEAMMLALEALTHGCPPDCKGGMTDSGGIHPWGEAVLVPCPNCKAITALREALAENPAQQEPVGEVEQIDIDEDGQASAWFRLNDNVELGDNLYTRHQAREPLTDKQIQKILKRFGWDVEGIGEYTNQKQVTFARAIEAKLKEKNT